MNMIHQNPDKIRFNWLSSNPNVEAIQILEQNQDKIDWEFLSLNPNAIQLLEQNQDKIDWIALSFNPNAIQLLEQNQDKIQWTNLFTNPNIFEHDYLSMSKERTKIIYQELIQKALHPSRVLKWIEVGIEDF